MKAFDVKQNILHPLKMGWYNFQIAVGGAWRFFCKQQTEQAREITKVHYGASTLSICDNAVILQCNGFTWHGGLADRLKGIVAVFDWCQRNGRSFRINFIEPFVLQDYLVPNEYNWIPDVVSYSKDDSLVKVCMMEPRTCNKKEVLSNQNQLLEEWMNENLSPMSKQIHIYTNMHCPDVDFSYRFHQLFKPYERLESEIAFHKNKIENGKYISISFRFTTLLGDFTDCTGSPLPKQERETLIRKSLDAITEISSQSAKADKILVTADSETFLKEVIKLDNVYVIPGKVGHIDYDHGDDVNMKTFLDFLMIADAEAVFLAKGPGMYNSAFAKTAALVNDRPFSVYEY